MGIIKKYLVIVTVSLLLSLYLFEIYSNLIFIEPSYKDIKKKYENETGDKYDERSLKEIYSDLKSENYVMTVFPFTHLEKKNNIFPLSGISDSKTIFCNENGYYALYNSDRYGFNNPDEEWDKKSIEYLLVGDSFTHGACVNRPDDIASVLRDLSKKSVLNLGYGGNGPLIEYAVLREYLRPNVKNVLWLYFEGNDLLNLKAESKNEILEKYFLDPNYSQNLKINQKNINKINFDRISSSFFDSDFRHIKKDSKLKYKVIKFLRLDRTKKTIISYFDTKKREKEIKNYEFDQFKEILNKSKDLIEKNGSNLYFVFLPEIERFKGNKGIGIHVEQNIKLILNDLKIPFVDINKEIFEKETDKLSLFAFNFQAHYTAKAYKDIAKIIYEKILMESSN